jgi:hypothetical protein
MTDLARGERKSRGRSMVQGEARCGIAYASVEVGDASAPAP